MSEYSRVTYSRHDYRVTAQWETDNVQEFLYGNRELWERLEMLAASIDLGSTFTVEREDSGLTVSLVSWDSQDARPIIYDGIVLDNEGDIDPCGTGTIPDSTDIEIFEPANILDWATLRRLLSDRFAEMQTGDSLRFETATVERYSDDDDDDDDTDSVIGWAVLVAQGKK